MINEINQNSGTNSALNALLSGQMSNMSAPSSSNMQSMGSLPDIFNALAKPAAATSNDSSFGFIISLVKTVADSVTKAITSVLNTVLPFVGFGGMGATSNFGGLNPMLTGAQGQGEMSAQEPGFWDSLKVVGQGVWDFAKDYLPDSLKKPGKIIENVWDYGKKAYDYISDNAGSVWDGVKSVGSYISKGASSIWDGVKSVGSWIGSFF